MNTTDSKHDLPIAPGIFQTEDPETYPVEANKIWASDISYIPTDEGFVFLGTYLDLFTRKVTGFAVADHMRTELLMEALTMALGRQSLPRGELLSHSDCGVQYGSEAYREKLKSCGIVASMSRKGNCYDNAFVADCS